MSEAENGDLSNWENLNASEFAEKYILPYLKIVKRCGSPIYKNLGSNCFPNNDTFYKLNGEKQNLGGDCRDAGWWDKSVLSNGMMIAICKGTGEAVNQAIILVDVNGKRGKSIVGKDVFAFKLLANYKQKLVPGGGDYMVPAIERTREYILNDTKFHGCNVDAKYYSFDCTALIAIDGWEIKDDYPW